MSSRPLSNLMKESLLDVDSSSGASSSHTRCLFVSIVVALGGFLFGYNISSLNGPLTDGDPASLSKDFEMTSLKQQLATGALLLGAIISALFISIPVEKYGRRAVLLLNNFLFICGGVLSAATPTYWPLVIGRLISGLGVGVVSVLVPQLISELSPVKQRGTFTALNQLLITIGILVAQLVYYGFHEVDHGWRYSVGLSAAPAAIQLAMMFFIPESPRWILRWRGDDEEAMKQLSRVRGNLFGSAVDHRALREEMEELRSLVEEEKASSAQAGSWGDLFKNKRAVIIGIGGNLAQTLTGINAVIYYSSKLFHFCGIQQEQLATIGLTSLNVLVTVISLLLVDRYGRKPLLLTGTAVMIFSLLVAGILLVISQKDSVKEHDDQLKYIPLVMILTYVVGFAVGLGACLWTILGEIFPNNVRSKGMSLCLAVNWSCNLLLALTVLTAIEGIGGGSNDDQSKVGAGGLFLIFCGLASLAFAFIYFVVPETKGKTIEQIQMELNPESLFK
eukprot:TRINITY_DN2513_c0_g1_i1.p1 TRINITY_DN2513_c0_g1~~TRINITY_DN2513_c0_g1_i1.p1  ORF type:complete len:505 (-),score=104.55 TRINITY_DN2513_c0_g1_i1:174-1688(-)